jgi:hypothetical protein
MVFSPFWVEGFSSNPSYCTCKTSWDVLFKPKMFTDLVLCFMAVRAKGDASENVFIDPAGLHLTFDFSAWEHAQVSGFNVAVRSASKAWLVVNVGVPEF